MTKGYFCKLRFAFARVSIVNVRVCVCREIVRVCGRSTMHGNRAEEAGEAGETEEKVSVRVLRCSVHVAFM